MHNFSHQVPIQNTRFKRKQRPSRFFDQFINKYGQGATLKAEVGEVQRSLKQFYLDLAFGNIAQDKYLQYLDADPQIIIEAIKDIDAKLRKFAVLDKCFVIAFNTMDPVRSLPEYQELCNENAGKIFTYTTIKDNLYGYYMTRDFRYIQAISAKLNNQAVRGSKELLL